MSLWFSKSIFCKILDFRHLASLQFTNISLAVMHEFIHRAIFCISDVFYGMRCYACHMFQFKRCAQQ